METFLQVIFLLRQNNQLNSAVELIIFFQDYTDSDLDVLLCAYDSQEYNDAKTELGL